MPDPDPNANGDTVTISRADLTTLQNSYKLLNGLWDHPVHGAPTKKAAKDINPELRIPELDVAEPLLKPIRERQDALEKENSDLKEQIEKDREERATQKAIGDLTKGLDAAQRRYRLTDEAMEEVKKIMGDRNIADPMAAAAFVVSEIEPAKPVSGSNFAPQDLNAFEIDGSAKDDDTKLLHNDPVKWLDKAVPEIMAEFDQAAA